MPYGLSNGLLNLYEQDPQNSQSWVAVDVRQLLKVVPKKEDCLSLSSPVKRTQHWRDAFTVYECHIIPDEQLLTVLKPGGKYRIQLASSDLGVQRWCYGDSQQLAKDDARPDQRLINSKPSAGHATFKVVESLLWPPDVETHLHLGTSSASPDVGGISGDSESTSPAIHVSVLNAGQEIMTIQTNGHQKFLVPWSPFQPESDADDSARVIHASPGTAPISGLKITDSMTGEALRGGDWRGSVPLMVPHADRRPKAEDLLTLKPGASITRTINIEELMNGIGDGKYQVQIRATGCRWWHGDVVKEIDESNKLPSHLCHALTPPLMLASQDKVTWTVKTQEGQVLPCR